MGLRSWWRSEWQEAKDAGREIWTFAREHDWKKSARNSVRRKYWGWWIAAIIGIVAIGLIAYYRDTIVEKFEPHKDTIVNFPASWVFPILILVILSFPPLGGHEVVILVIGLIWGIWIGFAITCAGTLIGEVLCFFLFKYLLTDRAAQVEQKSIFYACIARLMRHGGLWIIIVVRFSAIPGHVVTAIQSTVGMSVWIYSIAVIVSLPKQLAVVYLGSAFADTNADGSKTSHSGVSLAIFAITCLATVLALYIVYMRARKLYPEVLRDMEDRQASKDSLAAAGSEEDGSLSHPGPSGGRMPHAPRRRSSLIEAGMEGDEGIPYIAPENAAHASPGGRGGAHPMVRTNTGGTWRSSFDDDEMRGHRERDEQGAWQDGGGVGGYGRLGGESQSSFAHLPLASESEVGVTPRPGAPSAPPSYVSRPGGGGSGPYSDPFANPSQQSLASHQHHPYGGAIYGPSSSTVSIALDRPPTGPTSIPYHSPDLGAAGRGAGGSGSRPVTMGGTEIMTGVGAGGAALRGAPGGGGGGYGATSERR